MSQKVIAVIDDDSDFQAHCKHHLERAGYVVQAILSGRNALAEVARISPALVLLDGLLPGILGPELARLLRQDDRTADIPIVFLSALFRDLKTYRMLTEECKVALVLHKPIDGPALVEHVRSIVGAEAPRSSDGSDESSHLVGATEPRGDVPVFKFPEEFELALEGAALNARTSPASLDSSDFDRLIVAGEPDLDVPIEIECEAPSLEQGFAKLRAEYLLTVPEKIRALHAGIDALARGHSEPLRSTAHKLHGSAGSYGFERVSELAAALEQRIEHGDGPFDIAAMRRDVTDIELALRPFSASEPPGRRHARRANARRMLLMTSMAEVARDFERLALARGIELRATESVVSARSLVAGFVPEVVYWDAPLSDEAFAFFEELRRRPGATSVVYIGGEAPSEERLSAMRAGADAVMIRPYSLEDLIWMSDRMRPSVSLSGTVVVADDDPDVVSHISDLLRGETIQVYQCMRPEALLEVLERRWPDVLLLDLSYGAFDGTDLCRAIRGDPRFDELAILIVTAGTAAEVRLRAFRAGADDFITKPFLAEELLARVRSRLERAALVRSRLGRDPGTGLWSRRRFEEVLGIEVEANLSFEHTGAIALVGLAERERLREELGPRAESRALKFLAAHLVREMPVGLQVGRFGSGVLALHVRGFRATDLLAKLGEGARTFERAALAASVEGHRVEVGIGFGAVVAEYPTHGVASERLLSLASRRLESPGRSRTSLDVVPVPADRA